MRRSALAAYLIALACCSCQTPAILNPAPPAGPPSLCKPYTEHECVGMGEPNWCCLNGADCGGQAPGEPPMGAHCQWWGGDDRRVSDAAGVQKGD